MDERNIEKLIFKQFENNPRFTQDSPVYPDVWMEYFNHLESIDTYRADLILVPHKQSSAAELLKDLLRSFEGKIAITRTEIASNGDTIVAKLAFEELIHIALPLTNWWKNYLLKDGVPTDDYRWLRRLVGAFLVARQKEFGIDSSDLSQYFDEFERAGKIFIEQNEMILFKGTEVPKLWAISRNRSASVSIELSVPATKADAGRRLFDIDGSGIAWAVLDSGIDITHRAFRAIDPKTKKLYPVPLGEPEDPASNFTRIIATYEFTKFRKLLNEILTDPAKARIWHNSTMQPTSNENDEPLTEMQVSESVNNVLEDLQKGRMLDWSVISPLLRVPHNRDYVYPSHKHGTHVAGIIGANQAPEDTDRKLIGMCPGIQLYDIRVMDGDGTGDEFNILAAIQFVRWMNSQRDGIVIHGINLSLSMQHEVDSYACGQTPVCESCERLVSEGTVVVTCSGNQGQAIFKAKEYGEVVGFRTVNITDPGNAENVITVGSTHRNRPHSYGVSYFSSKGPTGDGRIKPDLVAPGEKIVSTGFNNKTERMDGTSMATPHVSGAAALLMAKHRELIGRPKRIKEILCKTATDLGRERYFQGCGMLDVLRAIQAV